LLVGFIHVSALVALCKQRAHCVMSLAGFVGVTLFTNMAAGACDCKEEPANPNPGDHEVKPHIVLSFLSFFPSHDNI
jgi:hypothetical protein